MIDAEPTVLSLSDAAVLKLRDYLAAEADPKAGVRVIVQARGCSGFAYGLMIEDAPTAEDRVMVSNGVTVYLDDASRGMIQGATIDYIEGEQGTGFTVNNPNTAPACACGTHAAGSQPSAAGSATAEAAFGEAGGCADGCGGHGEGAGAHEHGAGHQHGAGGGCGGNGACGCGGHSAPN